MLEEISLEIKFRVPGKDEPGFLRRQRDAVRFGSELRSNPSVELMDEMVAFLAQFVEEPAGESEAIEALLDASQNQFQELLKAISGGETNPT